MCIFCKIINKEIPSTYIYEDELLVVIKDINPAAEIHYLVIPKVHCESLKDADALPDNTKIALLDIFPKISSMTDRVSSDFKVVVNNGQSAGQQVFHLHFHYLAGKMFKKNLPV